MDTSTSPDQERILTDAEALCEFETCAIPPAKWTHGWHLRIACAYLHQYPLDEALDRMRQGIKRLNASHEVPEALDSGYHESITVAWMTLLEATILRDGKADDAQSFLETHPVMVDRKVLLRFYSRDRIMSWEAKERFVEPDLGPILAIEPNADRTAERS